MLLLALLYRHIDSVTRHSDTRSLLLQSCARPPALVPTLSITPFPLPAFRLLPPPFNASLHRQVIDEEELVEIEQGWRSITQGFENMTHLLSTNLDQHAQSFPAEPQIPQDKIIDIKTRFSYLTLEISTLKSLYLGNLRQYHKHISRTYKSLQSSTLTKSQRTSLRGGYEALALLSAKLTPEKAAWTAWVDASKSHDGAIRGLEVFEDENSRLDEVQATVKEINRNIDCLAFLALSYSPIEDSYARAYVPPASLCLRSSGLSMDLFR